MSSHLDPCHSRRCPASSTPTLIGLATLLDALVLGRAAGRQPQELCAHKTSATLLVTTSDRYMGDVGVHSPGIDENWPVLADAIRSGEPRAPIDEAFYERFARASFLTQLRGARFVATRLGFNAATKRHVLDLGAGGAPWSIALLEAPRSRRRQSTTWQRSYPSPSRSAASTGSPIDASSLAAIITRFRWRRAHSIPAFLAMCCVPKNRPTRSLYCDVLQQPFVPAARSVVADYFVGNDRRGPPQALLLGLTMVANTPHGKTYTHSEMASWLADACFGNVRTLETVKNNHVLVASKEVP